MSEPEAPAQTEYERGFEAGISHIEKLSMAVEDGKLDLEISGKMTRIIAAHLANYFEQKGGPNYAEMEVSTPTSGPLVLTMQRKWGKTPHQLRVDAESERDAAKAHFWRACELLAQLPFTNSFGPSHSAESIRVEIMAEVNKELNKEPRR